MADGSQSLVEQLCVVGRAAVAAGLVVGSGGNLSARLPGAARCWVTGAGSWLDRLTPKDFVEIPISRRRPRSVASGTAPSTEVALHLATYRARPDVNAVIHLHPQVAILLDALGESVRLITTDHAYYLRRVARVPFHPPGTARLAQAAAAAVADGTNCVILAHHGCSVLGSDVAMAHRRASNLDEAARLTYRALLLTGGLAGRSIPECPWELAPPTPGVIPASGELI
ncbi:MAG TPA: class II aldolase/adducin family protein [Micromonosporaceae bacterium]